MPLRGLHFEIGMGVGIPPAYDLCDRVTGPIDRERPRGFFPFIACVGFDVEFVFEHPLLFPSVIPSELETPQSILLLPNS
jgi:hypothetical protein